MTDQNSDAIQHPDHSALGHLKDVFSIWVQTLHFCSCSKLSSKKTEKLLISSWRTDDLQKYLRQAYIGDRNNEDLNNGNISITNFHLSSIKMSGIQMVDRYSDHHLNTG